ncbi:MAG: replicative DNA helicase [Spirochaetes bacterium]|nr:replicative DNA helicase [Spirochaetota bacterium]
MSETKSFTGKVPPQNINAERHLLASILIDPGSYELVQLQKIGKKDFYDTRHQFIYQAICELNKKGKPIDLITLTEIIETMNLREKSGGADYISALLDSIPTSANVEYYAEIVKQKSILRQLIHVSGDLISKSMENPEDVYSLIDQAEKNIFDINQDSFTSNFSHIKQVLNEAIEELAHMDSSQGSLSGVPSGYPDLDERTDGFQKQEMVIIAARPSAGKTSFALNVACNSAIRKGKKIGFFSCEMNKDSLVKRMLCSEAQVNQLAMRKGMLSQIEKERIVQAAGNLYETIIVFDDTPNIPIMELRSKARKMKKDYDIDMLMIDYLQLITVGDEMGKNTPRHEQIGYVSRSLKGLARELDVPVIALAQLNRNVESRGDESRPRLSDLKDSGSIEQDADVILFIHNKSSEENKSQETDVREVIIGKNRNGPTDIIKMVFLKNYTRFQLMTKAYAGE